MTLVLQITNVDRLENGVATRLVLDRHGAVIGRSPTADWSLPDPQHYISSTHCEIDYRDGGYTLVDKSTNGTFVNGGQARMAGPHRIVEGDEIVIGHYRIGVKLEGEAAGASGAATAPPSGGGAWGGWQPQPAAASSVDAASWDRPAPQAAISGRGPLSQSWAPPAAEASAPVQPAAPAASAWAATPAVATPASAWSSPVAESAGPSATDVWGQLAASNVVDWARGGFGDGPRGQPDPLGLGAARQSAPSLGVATAAPTPTPEAQPPIADWAPRAATAPPQPAETPAWRPPPETSDKSWAPPAQRQVSWGAPSPARPAAPLAPTAPIPPPQAPGPAHAAPSVASPVQPGGELAAFLAGAGLQPTDLKTNPAQAMNAAGSVMRRVISGLVVMLEARARAKSQLGAQGTSLEFDGNNPLKFARAPEKAVAQLLNPPERGFMSADRAIEDAFRDLQAHQMATLAAMQGALQSTLARFSPEAIRERADKRGLIEKLLPGSREAALWQTYEREFEGVARGSDEAFMDVFAKEFRQAYERVSAEMKRKA
jgi:type VI secretion system FHA domain protein